MYATTDLVCFQLPWGFVHIDTAILAESSLRVLLKKYNGSYLDNL
jgi:hypothetical protein